MSKLKVTTDGGVTERAFEGTPLLSDLLPEIDKPCGGKGICGKCRVTAHGALSEPTAMERAQLSDKELSSGVRYACQAKVLGEAEVLIVRDKALQNIETLGQMPAFEKRPMPGRYAIAADIGTTTVAVCAVDLETCQVIGTASLKNPQTAIAADVIGRIEAALRGEGARLESLIRDCLRVLCREALKEDADVSVVTGNTTMLYLLTGRSPEPLSHAPFEADCLFDVWDNNAYLPACFSAFVGADIACAVLASGMMKKSGTSLLIDIGTNGELALLHEGTLYCCATAAGPAFEGVGISCGTGSVAGAIDKVRAVDGKLAISTIQGAQPVGLCGSGVLDAAAALLELELLDEAGGLDDDAELAPGVSITQADIRSVQLAKGAIAAGIKTLVMSVGIAFEDIDTLYIAGGFGKHLNLKSAAQIGMIPSALTERAIVLGNASLTGAALMLVDRENVQKTREMVKNSVTVPLGGSAEFSNNFMESMMFEAF